MIVSKTKPEVGKNTFLKQDRKRKRMKKNEKKERKRMSLYLDVSRLARALDDFISAFRAKMANILCPAPHARDEATDLEDGEGKEG